MPASTLLEQLRSEAEQLRFWLLDDALPLWAGAGIDGSGACWEALDFQGKPVANDTVRVRVVARQLFVFCLARRLNWQRERSADIIDSLFETLHEGCRRHDGLFGKLYRLDTQSLGDDTYDLYDTAFALLGFAVARERVGAARADKAITATLAALDADVAHPEGGYLEQVPAPKDRLQNPHMHLFESFLALRDAGYGIDDRLQRLIDFISTRFFDPELEIVHERRPGDSSRNVTFEPGHSLEWVWLLSWHAGMDKRQLAPFARQLYGRASRVLDRNGYACMEASLNDNHPDGSQRLWSQAEALKAHVSTALTSPSDDRHAALVRATELCRGIRRDWLAPAFAGGWHDHRDAEGSLLSTGMPASTGYHLFGAIEVLLNAVERLEAPPGGV